MFKMLLIGLIVEIGCLDDILIYLSGAPSAGSDGVRGEAVAEGAGTEAGV